MRPLLQTAACLAMALLTACGRGNTKAEIRDTPQESVAVDADPLNQVVANSTTDGLLLVLTIDGDSIHLDQATPSRVPRARADSGGDRVTATGFARGSQVSQVSVADGVVNVQEGGGLVRLTRRQVIVPLPAPRPLDAVEISAPATGARARLDVRAAYAMYCRGAKRDPRMCPE